MKDIKDRISKVDDRIPVLIKKYPVVSAVMTLVPFILGVVVGKLL